ncbi:MAG: site-2 protease family protein [Oscillospiraceae bacterium]|nr:site-2 protease family protein [Oscillospiraceae bacterium]
MITIITAMLVFGVIIAIHEFGHFAMAKLCKIKVNKFAIGMGPVILKKQGKETEYSLRLLPIGGFCAMEGEDSQSDDKNSFHNKPVWQRMLVVLAGAVMNLILGFLLIICTTLL